MYPSSSRSHRHRRTFTAALSAAAVALTAVAATGPAAADATVDEAKLAVYVEVNSNDLANVADYTLADSGRPAVDLAMIFAANINYDGQQAYLHLNERVTETLQDADGPAGAAGVVVLNRPAVGKCAPSQAPQVLPLPVVDR